MKLKYAKLWLKKWIKYNYGKYDRKTFNSKLNWAIVNLSHRVYKAHGLKGHNTRKTIRKKLWDYSKRELKNYQPNMINKILSYFKRFFYK